MAKDSIPTGRLRRTARIGGLAGGTAARSYAARAADLTRSEQKRQEAAERRQVQMAERILDVLGQMKGAAMKIGQVASFVDSGALPPEVHRRLEEKLAELRDSAPRVRFDEMRKVLESDLERAARGRVRRVRDGGVRRRVDRPGVPRAAQGRPARGGEDPVPGHRAGRALGPSEPRADTARGEDDGPRHGPEGDGGGDSRAPHRGARLRARGPDPSRLRADLARASVRGDPGGGDEPVERARARHRVRRGPRLRAGEGAAAARARPVRRDRVPVLPRARCTARGASPRIRTRATTC